MHRKTLEQEGERVRMCAVQKDLQTCYSKLAQREEELQERAGTLARHALSYRKGKNLCAAKKKMVERARVLGQLEKVQNSIAMIDMHRS